VTPEEIERARNHCSRIKGLNSAEKPLTEVRGSALAAAARLSAFADRFRC
jgi:hypothetical protein